MSQPVKRESEERKSCKLRARTRIFNLAFPPRRNRVADCPIEADPEIFNLSVPRAADGRERMTGPHPPETAATQGDCLVAYEQSVWNL